MSRSKLLTALFILFAPFIIEAQVVTISGIVQTEDGQTLPYVSIGIKAKNIGTISNKEGRFELALNSQHLQDTLTFSYVGFQDLDLPIRQIVSRNLNDFKLAAKSHTLQGVVVTNKKLTTKKVGTTSHNPFIYGKAESKDTTDIVEFAKLIPLKNQNAQLVKAAIFLQGLQIDTATFRINFYKVREGLPAGRMVEKHIVQVLPVRQGWLTFDLSDYDIVLDQDFYIGFEFLPQRKMGKYTLGYGGQFGGGTLTRKSSLGTWQKQSGATLSAYVEVKL